MKEAQQVEQSDFDFGFPDREDLITMLTDARIQTHGCDFFVRWHSVREQLKDYYKHHTYEQLRDVCVQEGLIND